MKEYSYSNEQCYINAKELYDELGRCIESGDAFGVVAETLEVVRQRILGFPKADVKPVIHAHWDFVDASPDGDFYAICTACKEGFVNIVTNYCPHCGAIMYEENK